MKKIKVLCIFTLLFSLIACERFEIGAKDPGPVTIYKTRHDYQDLVTVSLTLDKSKVSSYPGPTDIDNADKPVKLANDYYASVIWMDYVFTDIKIDDWGRIWDSIHEKNVETSQFLYDHIIDFDPYVEFYIDYERIVDYNPDTSFLNSVIRNKELIRYFERVK